MERLNAPAKLFELAIGQFSTRQTSSLPNNSVSNVANCFDGFITTLRPAHLYALKPFFVASLFKFILNEKCVFKR